MFIFVVVGVVVVVKHVLYVPKHSSVALTVALVLYLYKPLCQRLHHSYCSVFVPKGVDDAHKFSYPKGITMDCYVVRIVIGG